MKSLIHRKERVILTAIEIISDLGIRGLSTREIARRQEVSEGTLFKHFKSKNEILIGVLDHYSQYDKDIFESVKIKKMNFIDSTNYFINSYAEYYENYPEITAITQLYEVFLRDPNLSEKIKEIYNSRHNKMVEIIDIAKEADELDANFNSIHMSDSILGFFYGACLRWRLQGFNFSLQNYTLEGLDRILKSYLKNI